MTTKKVRYTKTTIKQLVNILEPKKEKTPSYRFTGRIFYEKNK